MFRIRLKSLREEAHMSQASLAQALGVGQSTVGMWESGKNSPNMDMIIKLADLFDCSTDYLLGRVAYPELEKRKAPPESGAVSYDAAKGSSDLSAEEIQKLRKLLDNLPD